MLQIENTLVSIDIIKEKVDRIPIPNEIIERLMVECDWKCCICTDITKFQPVIIHHIIEYSLTQDNSYDNLVVICLRHHADAHTEVTIAKNPLPPELIKNKKAELIKKIKCYKENSLMIIKN